MKLSQFVRLAASQSMITVPYLEKLSGIVRKDSANFFPQTADTLEQLAKRLADEFSGVKPFPVDDLWGYLAGKGTPSDEIEALKKIKAPRAKKAKPPEKMDSYTAWSLIEKASGKSVIDGVRWEDSDYGPVVKALAKAFETLKKHKRAYKVFQKSVKNIKLTDRGNADASWLAGGILRVRVARSSIRVPIWRNVLVHEMGHAFEDYFSAMEIAKLYGYPPYLTDIAQRNYSEDFAETFRALEVEPALLKRKTPEKHADMLQRTKDKLR